MLEEFDAACSRLVTRSHTSLISRETVENIALKLRLALLPCLVSGGVFSCDTDDLWPLSSGSDVTFEGGLPDEDIIASGFNELANACVPQDERFALRAALWDSSQLTKRLASLAIEDRHLRMRLACTLGQSL